MNGAFAEESIGAPDEICYNITNPSDGRNDQAQFEPPPHCVAKRKRWAIRCGRRKIVSLVFYCCSFVSDFLRTVYIEGNIKEPEIPFLIMPCLALYILHMSDRVSFW